MKTSRISICIMSTCISLLSIFITFDTTFAIETNNSWNYNELKILDFWGDINSDSHDIIAVYQKENNNSYIFRIDFVNILSDSIPTVYFLLDHANGGNSNVTLNNEIINTDINWDILVSISESNQGILYDTLYNEYSNSLIQYTYDSKLDFLEFSISKDLLNNQDSMFFAMQVFSLNQSTHKVMDKTPSFTTNDSTGRVKIVLSFMNAFVGYGPHAVSWYDGYALHYRDRQGERGGLKYLLDGVEKYELPLTINDLRIEQLPGNEYLHINDRIKYLANKNLLDPLTTLSYGHFMCWQSSFVDSQAITLAIKLREQLGLPVSDVIYPYESMLKYEDIDIIKKSGLKAIYGLDRYNYWFGPITDWSNAEFVKEKIESSKKIHEINGMKFFFQPIYGGFAWDSRWGELDWSIDQWAGTDNGLFLWLRRIFLDMAMDQDQEKYYILGTDLNLTSWLYQDDVERDFSWIASHPWIEVTTLSDILTRNWTPIQHPEIILEPDDPLEQYQVDNDGHYNAYFWQFYYGGSSDGHSPFIPEGVQIESYFDYVPYLRNGEKIQTALKMGDEQTPGTIIYNTVQNLKFAPDNNLKTLAWLSYFTSIAEQTFHAQNFYAGSEPGNDWGGQYLHPAAKFRANDVRQVNKITEAANWIYNIIENKIGDDTEILQQDLDFDGEMEYVMRNQQLFLIFENDGGRIEYAFSYDPDFGTVQHIAPIYQQFVTGDGWGWNYEEGEIATAPTWNRAADAGFVDDIDNDYQFDYPVYDALIDENCIQFITSDGSLSKTYILEGNQIIVSYKLITLESIEFGVGLVANMLNMFLPSWSDKIEIERQDEFITMKINDGGFSTIDFSDPNIYFISLTSFNDSPARTELKERESYDNYPNGHWLFYPYNTVSFGGIDEFTIKLTLSSRSMENKVNHQNSNLLSKYKLYNNYPNPFNSSTIITFNLPIPNFVDLKVYNYIGQEIKTIIKKEFPSGTFTVKWDGTDNNGNKVSSGIYFYQIQSGDFIKVKKGLLLR